MQDSTRRAVLEGETEGSLSQVPYCPAKVLTGSMSFRFTKHQHGCFQELGGLFLGVPLEEGSDSMPDSMFGPPSLLETSILTVAEVSWTSDQAKTLRAGAWKDCQRGLYLEVLQ